MSALVELIDRDADAVLRAVDLSPLDGKSIAITGASGLIGVYLLAALRRHAAQTGKAMDVTVVSRSVPPPAFAELMAGNGFRRLELDLADTASYTRLPSADYVIHAAGYGQPGKFMESPTKTIQLNTAATAALLEKQPAGGKFLFVSTSEIYSGSPRLPHRESDIGTTDPSHPRSCYIEGKRCGEAVCHAFRSQGRDAKIARLSLAYGPGTRTDDQRVLNSLIRRALQEKRIALMDQGEARRTYGYITDAVEMLLSIMLYGKHATYNVGGISTTTILELAQNIGRLTGAPVSTPEKTNAAAGAPSDVALDLSLYCDEFQKRAFVPMDEGLQRTVAWQRELYA